VMFFAAKDIKIDDFGIFTICLARFLSTDR